MRTFFHSRRTRNSVGVMIFVWLMSLGIGVANACLVQQGHGRHEHVSHQHLGMTSALLAEHELRSGQPEAGQVHVHGNDQAPDQLACSDFCVAAQSTPVKNPMDGCTVHDMAPVPTLSWLLVPPVDQATPLATLEWPIGSEPPISIRFLRLTI